MIRKSPKSADIIHPILRGRDIDAYDIKFADLWIIFIPWHFPLHKDSSVTGSSSKAENAFKEEYPEIFEHLIQFKFQLSERNKAETGIRYEWYALQRCANTYFDEFKKEKIVYSEIVQSPCFALDKTGYLVNDTCFIIAGNDLEFILLMLNSLPISYFFQTFYAGGGLGEKGIRYKKAFLENLPLSVPDDKLKKSILTLYEKISNIKDNTLFTHKLNRIIYEMYNLSDEEIALIEKL